MTTTPLTPAALAEIRERAAENPNWFRAEAKDVSACFADRHHLLADYAEREKRTAGLVHELLECQAEVSRLTAELAAARKPQPLTLPRNAGGLLQIHMLEAVAERADEIGHGGAPLPACHGELQRVGHILLALESLGAQDGGEGQS